MQNLTVATIKSPTEDGFLVTERYTLAGQLLGMRQFTEKQAPIPEAIEPHMNVLAYAVAESVTADGLCGNFEADLLVKGVSEEDRNPGILRRMVRFLERHDSTHHLRSHGDTLCRMVIYQVTDAALEELWGFLSDK